MALGQVPPWLEGINPSSFTQAGLEGARLGMQLGDQQTQVVQQNAARQQQAQQVAAQRAQQQQEFQEGQQLDQERLATQKAEAQQRLQLETQTAARKFQAQQMYQQALTSGQDPIQAMLAYGPSMGESMAGLGPLSLSETRMKQASVPPQPVAGPDGQPVGYTYGGNMHMLPRKQVTLPNKLSQLDEMAAKAAHDELQAVNKQESTNATEPDAGTARSLLARRKAAQDTLDELHKKYGDEADDGAGDDSKTQAQTPTAPPAASGNGRFQIKVINPGGGGQAAATRTNAPATLPASVAPTQTQTPPAARPQTPAATPQENTVAEGRQAEAEDSEIASNNSAIETLQKHIKDYENQPMLKADAEKKLALYQARQKWLETTPHVGPEPPAPSSSWW